MQPGGAAPQFAIPKRLNAVELNAFCGTLSSQTAGGRGWVGTGQIPGTCATSWLPWSQAACFRKSGGSLSCLTCHDPHALLATSAKAYDQRCAGCHKGRATPDSHRQARRRDGATCPRYQWSRPEVHFTNHWIGIYAKGNSLVPVSRPDRSPPPLPLPPTAEGKSVPPNAPSSLLHAVHASGQQNARRRSAPWHAEGGSQPEGAGPVSQNHWRPGKAAAVPLGRALEIDDRRNNDPGSVRGRGVPGADRSNCAGNRQRAFQLFQQGGSGRGGPAGSGTKLRQPGMLDPARASLITTLRRSLRRRRLADRT